MTITNLSKIEGKNIAQYMGTVFAEVICVVSDINYFTDIPVVLQFENNKININELTKAKNTALREIEKKAVSLGANAIIGADFDYEVYDHENNKLMITISGIAIVAE